MDAVTIKIIGLSVVVIVLLVGVFSLLGIKLLNGMYILIQDHAQTKAAQTLGIPKEKWYVINHWKRLVCAGDYILVHPIDVTLENSKVVLNTGVMTSFTKYQSLYEDDPNIHIVLICPHVFHSNNFIQYSTNDVIQFGVNKT